MQVPSELMGGPMDSGLEGPCMKHDSRFPVGLRWRVPEIISLGTRSAPGHLLVLSRADNLGEISTSACLPWLSPSSSMLVHRSLQSWSLSRTEEEKKVTLES